MEYVVIFSNKRTSSFSITYSGTSNGVVWLCSILGDEEFPEMSPRIWSISSIYAMSSHAINRIDGKKTKKEARPIYCLEVIKCILWFFYITLIYIREILYLIYIDIWFWITYSTEAKRFCDRTSVIILISKNFGILIKTDRNMTGSVDATTRLVAV